MGWWMARMGEKRCGRINTVYFWKARMHVPASPITQVGRPSTSFIRQTISGTTHLALLGDLQTQHA